MADLRVGDIAAIKQDCRPDLYYRCGKVVQITDETVSILFLDDSEEEFSNEEVGLAMYVFKTREKVSIAQHDEIEYAENDDGEIYIDRTYIPQDMLEEVAGETVKIDLRDCDYFTGYRIDKYTDNPTGRRWSYPYRLIVNPNVTQPRDISEIATDAIDQILCL